MLYNAIVHNFSLSTVPLGEHIRMVSEIKKSYSAAKKARTHEILLCCNSTMKSEKSTTRRDILKMKMLDFFVHCNGKMTELKIAFMQN